MLSGHYQAVMQLKHARTVYAGMLSECNGFRIKAIDDILHCTCSQTFILDVRLTSTFVCSYSAAIPHAIREVAPKRSVKRAGNTQRL